MIKNIETIYHARNAVKEMASERMALQPDNALVELAADALVERVGGFGGVLTEEIRDNFDLNQFACEPEGLEEA